MKQSLSFWPVVILFFLFWIVRVLYLPAPDTTTASAFFLNTLLRLTIFLLPFLLVTKFFLHSSFRETFALGRPTRLGIALASLYSLGLIFFESVTRSLMLNPNPWELINFPFAPIIEELVFRGFIFTALLKMTDRVQAVLISSILFTMIYFPGWIFISGLKGESFLSVTGQVLIFAFIQGGIRYYSKSVYPTIVVHLINNFLAFVV